jgi:hypothetical protein
MYNKNVFNLLQLKKWLLKQNPIYLFFLFFLLDVLKMFFFEFIKLLLDIESNGLELKENSSKELFIISVFVPILETFFCFTLPILFLRLIRVKNNYLIIAIISVIFASQHDYSIIYIVFAFCSGVVMSVYYLIHLKKYNTITAFVMTTILHGVYNAFIYLY